MNTLSRYAILLFFFCSTLIQVAHSKQKHLGHHHKHQDNKHHYYHSQHPPGLGTLSPVTSFVRREGKHLILDGEPYRIAGPNIYWLALDENGPEASKTNPQPPSKQRVNEAMAIAVAMGSNTIRSTSLGVSVGKPITIHPSLHTYNYSNFEPLDYAVYAAGVYGLRLVIPLTDNYQYYSGGKYEFLKFRHVSTEDNGNLFYTNKRVISDFKKYISNVINHRNIYTGRLLSEEPSILAWQVGNELGGWRQNTGWPTRQFVQAIARYIKELAPNQLVASPEGSHWDFTTDAIAPSYTVEEIDIIDEHFYPIDKSILNTTLFYANKYDKAYMAGEADWTKDGESTTLHEYLNMLSEDGSAGSMVWSVFGHDSKCQGYIQHDDGYSIYFPQEMIDHNKQEYINLSINFTNSLKMYPQKPTLVIDVYNLL